MQMARRHMKKCSKSLIMMGMQTKTTVRYHFLPVRMAITKKKKGKCWQDCKGTRSLIYCWWEYNMVQQLWKTVWRFIGKLKIELPHDPAIPLLSIYPPEWESGSQRDYLHSHTHSTIIFNRQEYANNPTVHQETDE